LPGVPPDAAIWLRLDQKPDHAAPQWDTSVK
jgi:hypothetical protein